MGWRTALLSTAPTPLLIATGPGTFATVLRMSRSPGARPAAVPSATLFLGTPLGPVTGWQCASGSVGAGACGRTVTSSLYFTRKTKIAQGPRRNLILLLSDACVCLDDTKAFPAWTPQPADQSPQQRRGGREAGRRPAAGRDSGRGSAGRAPTEHPRQVVGTVRGPLCGVSSGTREQPLPHVHSSTRTVWARGSSGVGPGGCRHLVRQGGHG